MTIEGIQDWNGGVVVGVALREPPDLCCIAVAGVNVKEHESAIEPFLSFIDLQRVNEPWAVILAEAARLANLVAFMILDKTIVVEIGPAGAPIVDSIHAIDADFIDARAVSLVDARTASFDDIGVELIPRADVTQALLDAYRNGTITIASRLDLASTLEADIRNVSLERAQETSSLALSVALAVSYARGEFRRSFSYGDEETKPYDPMEWMDR